MTKITATLSTSITLVRIDSGTNNDASSKHTKLLDILPILTDSPSYVTSLCFLNVPRDGGAWWCSDVMSLALSASPSPPTRKRLHKACTFKSASCCRQHYRTCLWSAHGSSVTVKFTALLVFLQAERSSATLRQERVLRSGRFA